MTVWTPFPYAGAYKFTPTSVKKHWPRLHAGDAQPLPHDNELLQAWALFHNGHFQKAAQAGLSLGVHGVTLANKATCIYANYLEPSERVKLQLLSEVAERAQAQAEQHPELPNAWYWQAYALGRYSQGISVAKGLALGLGTRVKTALEKTIALQPKHADAHLALAAFHAEVIDKVGALIGGLTYGAKKEMGLSLYAQAMNLNPDAPMTLVEYANGLVMLEGSSRIDEATALYERAANMVTLDATQRLEAELAKAQLEDE